MDEVLDIMKKRLAIEKGKYGIEFTQMRSITGSNNPKVVSLAFFDSLSALEEKRKALDSDSELQALTKQLMECIVHGVVGHDFYQVIE